MKILVQAKDMKVTKAIYGFVDEKVKRNILKLGQKVIGVKVYLEKIARKKNDPESSTAKVEIEVPGNNIVVEGKSFDPYQAISQAIKAGGRRLRKDKEKKEKRKKGD
jgi:ribosomal subunit interface protein